MIADVATEIEAARLLVWRAAWMGRNGVPMTSGQGSMSKLKGGDVTMWATTTLMDLVGPEAQSMDCPLEKWFRDAKIYQIFEGTAQIQRLVIARMQAAEYAERLQFARDVAATNGTVVSQAPGNAQSETPRGRRAREGRGQLAALPAPPGLGYAEPGCQVTATTITRTSTRAARPTGGACSWRWRSTSRCSRPRWSAGSSRTRSPCSRMAATSPPT